MSKILTITSDLGMKDHYVAVIKGLLLSKNEGLQIVDVTHEIKHYDIAQAAFVVKNTWKNFPKGTVHLIHISHHSNPNSPMVLVKKEDQFFIAPDNGLLSLLFDEMPKTSFYLPQLEGNNHLQQHNIAEATAKIFLGTPLAEIGQPVDKLMERITLQPILERGQIGGTVIYIDHFGNAIINITKELFDRVQEGRSFKLFFRRNDPICQLSTHYSEVAVGETLCLFNDAGFLEIAINMGNAKALLGLKIDDAVQIDFEN